MICKPAAVLLALIAASVFTPAALAQDTDGDGLTDTSEINIHATLPLNNDTDGDSLSDGEEVNIYGTNPLNPDTDGDGLTDYIEALFLGDPSWNADPLNPDTDGDGTLDGDTDYDGDGLTAAQEFFISIFPFFGPSPSGDFDGDGLSNGDELWVYGTDPTTPDTDRDRLSDSDELFIYFSDPLARDTDGDGHLDGDEVQVCSTSPILADTDGDGTPDTCPCDQPTIQVHLVLDSELVQRYGAGAEDYARAVFEAAELLWNNPASNGGPGILIQLVDITTFTSGPNPWVSVYDSALLLTNFTDWSRTDLPVDAPVRDAVVLLTGNGLPNTGRDGLAWVGGVSSTYGVGHISSSGDILNDGTNLSHQLGHIMGADHDGSGNPCPLTGYIMGFDSGSEITLFSQCSIDNFQIKLTEPGIAEDLAPDCPPPPCLADLNNDGFIDSGDINAFIALFLAGDPAVDFNNDGFIDSGDINEFITLFLAGC